MALGTVHKLWCNHRHSREDEETNWNGISCFPCFLCVFATMTTNCAFYGSIQSTDECMHASVALLCVVVVANTKTLSSRYEQWRYLILSSLFTIYMNICSSNRERAVAAKTHQQQQWKRIYKCQYKQSMTKIGRPLLINSLAVTIWSKWAFDLAWTS